MHAEGAPKLFLRRCLSGAATGGDLEARQAFLEACFIRNGLESKLKYSDTNGNVRSSDFCTSRAIALGIDGLVPCECLAGLVCTVTASSVMPVSRFHSCAT